MLDNYVARSEIMHMYSRLMWSEYGLGYPSMVHPALNRMVEHKVHQAYVAPIAIGVYHAIAHDEHPTHTHLHEWIAENDPVEPERVGSPVRYIDTRPEPGLERPRVGAPSAP